MFNVRFAISPPSTQELCNTGTVLSTQRAPRDPTAGLVHSSRPIRSGSAPSGAHAASNRSEEGTLEDLTRRQRAVLEALRRLHDQHGFAPSLREVADEVGLASVSSVHAHVVTLTERGLVERRPGQPRTVRRSMAGQRS
jgi:hypothetical protein